MDQSLVELELERIQRSTRTTFPAFIPWHNAMRMRFKWYYRWHLWEKSSAAHFCVLLGFVLGSLFAVYSVAVPNSRATTESANVVIDTKAKWQTGTNTNIDLDTTANSIQQTLNVPDTWASKTSLPTARDFFGMAVANDKVYAIGGYAGPSTGILKTVSEYTPSSNTWAAKTDMPTARYAFGAASVDNKIYAMGGYGKVAGSTINTVEEYDPDTNSWSTKANMPTARDTVKAVTVNNKIYAIGGDAGYGNLLSTVEEYDPATNSWASRASMSAPRNKFAAVAVNNKIYVIGGYRTGVLSNVEEYDPATNSWATKTSMPTARSDLALGVFNNKIYAIGGFNAGQLKTVEEYNPASDSWRSMADMPTARNVAEAASINNKIYVMGGFIAADQMSSQNTAWPGTLSYLSPATNTSAATQLDAGVHDIVNWTTFTPHGTTPANTSISFRFRTSADSSTWSTWSVSTPYAASIDLSGLTQQRYLQVETTLANTDGANTPVLNSYTANFSWANASCPAESTASAGNKDITSQTEWDMGSKTNAISTNDQIAIDDKSIQYIDISGNLLPAPVSYDPQGAQIDLHYDLGRIIPHVARVLWSGGGPAGSLLFSTDDSNWDAITILDGNNPGTIDFAPHNVRYVRVVNTCNYTGCIVDTVKLYQSSGFATHISAPDQLDGGENITSWTTFSPAGSIPANTSIDFRFRTSTDANTWGDWTISTQYSASIDLTTLLTADDSAKRYLEVETTLANSDGASTPILNSYSADFNTCEPDTPPAPTCIDGTQNGDETGVDCGGSCEACPVPPTCEDGIQNQGETGVDSGGPCPAAETCIDGIRNQNETDTDCGGVCNSCPIIPPIIPTCSDSIKNGNETGIDTGGSCPAMPTCNDGTRNQDETGIDCGGVCGACSIPPLTTPTCNDGIKNGDETGIDTGGACTRPDTCSNGIQDGDEQDIDCGGSCFSTCRDQQLKVEIAPKDKKVLPESRISYTAHAYLNEVDITNDTNFIFTIRDGGTILSQDKNKAVILAEQSLGKYAEALSVLATYKNYKATAIAGLTVYKEALPLACSGFCSVKESFVSTVRGLGENAANNPLVYLFASLLGALSLVPQMIHFTRDLMAPFAKGKDKHAALSLVYDSMTGLPQAGVRVMLIANGLGTLVAMAVTDKDGKYSLNVTPGESYVVRAEKPGFKQFEEQNGMDREGLIYTNNYFGGIFTAKENEYIFNKNIPLHESDSLSVAKEAVRRTKISQILTALNFSILLIGLGLTVVILTAYPTTLNYLVLSLYVLSIILLLCRVTLLEGRDYGIVKNHSDNAPVDLAVIRAIRTSDNSLAKTVVGDARGRYTLALPRGEYNIFASKQGLRQKQPIKINVKNSFQPRRDEIELEAISSLKTATDH